MAFKFDQSKFMFRAKAGVQQAIASPDLVLVQVVAAIDDVNKISNLMSERLPHADGIRSLRTPRTDGSGYRLAGNRTRSDKSL